MVFRLNAEGAKVLAEGRRGSLSADGTQYLALSPTVSISRILEFDARVERSDERFSRFPSASLCVDLWVLCGDQCIGGREVS